LTGSEIVLLFFGDTAEAVRRWWLLALRYVGGGCVGWLVVELESEREGGRRRGRGEIRPELWCLAGKPARLRGITRW